MPINPSMVPKLITLCFLSTINILTAPLEGGSHSLGGISLLWPPFPCKAMKATLFYLSKTVSSLLFSTNEQRQSFSNSTTTTTEIGKAQKKTGREERKNYKADKVNNSNIQLAE